MHSPVVVFVAVIVLLITAALPAVAVTQWARPRRVSRKTRRVRALAAVSVAALPMLWACVCFVSLLSPECFVVPAFGEEVFWEAGLGSSPVSAHSAGATRSVCDGPTVPSTRIGGRFNEGFPRTQRCGPLTFDRRDGVGGADHRSWSWHSWTCLSARSPYGEGSRELVLWTFADPSVIAYECHAADPVPDPYGVLPRAPPLLWMSAVHVPRGPGDNFPFALALFIASLALAAGSFARLQRTDRRSRSEAFAPGAPLADAPSDEEEDEGEVEVGITPFRTSRLARPARPRRRSHRRATFERGMRLRWCVAAAAFTAGLVASIAALSHFGHVPGRPLITTVVEDGTP